MRTSLTVTDPWDVNRGGCLSFASPNRVSLALLWVQWFYVPGLLCLYTEGKPLYFHILARPLIRHVDLLVWESVIFSRFSASTFFILNLPDLNFNLFSAPQTTLFLGARLLSRVVVCYFFPHNSICSFWGLLASLRDSGAIWRFPQPIIRHGFFIVGKPAGFAALLHSDHFACFFWLSPSWDKSGFSHMYIVPFFIWLIIVRFCLI